MPRFLDLNTSENAVAPFAAPVAIPTGPLVAASFAGNPGQFGGIGLSTQFVAGPTVDLAGTIIVASPSVATNVAAVTINIVRNPSSASPAIIYTLTATLTGATPSNDLSFNAQDLAAPAGQLTAYAAYVTQVTGAADTTRASRIGPETFWGIAADRTTG